VPGDPIYLFIHLFKTGGTTINGHLARHLSWDEEFVHLGPWGQRVRARDGQPDPSEWPQARWETVRAIAGHWVDGETHRLVPDREPRYLTILRDPADHLFSRYNFTVSRTGDETPFEDWYARRKPNQNLIRLRRAVGADSISDLRKVLDEFWFVGVTEHLDEDLPHLFAAIGAPADWINRRVTDGRADLEDLDIGRETFPIRRHAVLTDEWRERIHAEHRKDLRLYRYAVDRRRRLRASHGWDR